MITPEDTDVCVISRELADLNGLKVGDVLEFNNWKERETDDHAKVVGVSVEIRGTVILLSGISVLGIIMIAIAGSCIFIMLQKPKEILSKMS